MKVSHLIFFIKFHLANLSNFLNTVQATILLGEYL